MLHSSVRCRSAAEAEFFLYAYHIHRLARNRSCHNCRLPSLSGTSKTSRLPAHPLAHCCCQNQCAVLCPSARGTMLEGNYERTWSGGSSTRGSCIAYAPVVCQSGVTSCCCKSSTVGFHERPVSLTDCTPSSCTGRFSTQHVSCTAVFVVIIQLNRNIISNLTLPEKKGHLAAKNFIIRLLYKETY